MIYHEESIHSGSPFDRCLCPVLHARSIYDIAYIWDGVFGHYQPAFESSLGGCATHASFAIGTSVAVSLLLCRQLGDGFRNCRMISMPRRFHDYE